MPAIAPGSMTPARAVELLSKFKADTDRERAHMNAASVLCSLIRDLGYEDVAAAYLENEGWGE